LNQYTRMYNWTCWSRVQHVWPEHTTNLC